MSHLKIIKFKENPPSGNQVVTYAQTDGRTDSRNTDRHDKANSGYPQFCERA